MSDLRKRLRSRPPVRNAWVTISDCYLLERVAASGQFEAVTIDMQHGLFDLRAAIAGIRAIQGQQVSALVRLPGITEDVIGSLLDAGANGLICPQTGSATEAEQIVAACHYPPRGCRSFGPTRASFLPESFSADPVVFCMIESAPGFKKVASIAEVDGVDGLFIGPGDLGISLGLGPGQDREEPEFVEAVAVIKNVAAKSGAFLGIHANSARYAARMANEGFHLVTSWVDVVAIEASFQACHEQWQSSWVKDADV